MVLYDCVNSGESGVEVSNTEHAADVGGRIPIAEEVVEVAKREIVSGRVQVQTVVDSEVEMVREQLLRKDVEIERVERDLVLDRSPSIREEGNALIIPVVEERLVVTKQLVLVEEVHIRRRVMTQDVEEPVTVRRTRAVVERKEP